MSLINFIKTPHGNRTFNQFSATPVHNPVVYITSSLRSNRDNFKYKLDVIVNSIKISTLEKAPDFSTGDSRYGIFDLSEIVSTELGYDPKILGNQSFSNLWRVDEQMSKIVNVTCRHSYSTINKWNNSVNLSGFTRLFIEGSTDLVSGDKVLIGNTVFNVIAITDTTIGINAPWGTLNSTGTFREGQSYANIVPYFDEQGTKRAAFVVIGNTPRIANGDRILIKQGTSPTNPAYDGEWLCRGVEESNISPFITPQWIVKTNITWGTDNPIESGSLFNLSDYKPEFSISTNGTRSFVTNSVFQYEDFINYNDLNYQFGTINDTTTPFLSNSPKKTILGKDVPYSLGFLDNLPKPSNFWDHFKIDWKVAGFLKGGIFDTWPIITNDPNVGTNMEFVSFLLTSVTNGTGGFLQANIDTTVFNSLLQWGDWVGMVINGQQRRFRIIGVQQISPTNSLVTFSETTGAVFTGTFEVLVWLQDRTYFSTRLPQINFPYIQKEIELGHETMSNLPVFPKGLNQGVLSFTIKPVNRINEFYGSGFVTYGGVQRGEERFFEYKNTCQDWETFYLAWINPYGSWDYFRFEGRPRETNNFQREFARRSLPSYSSNNFTYELGDRGNVTYNIEGQRVIETSTGIINRETAKWINEIFKSPSVYVINGEGNPIPVNILNDSVVLPDNQRGLVNVPITFEYANKIFAQGN